MPVDAAVDDQATGNDGVVRAGFRQALRKERDFEGTGNFEVSTWRWAIACAANSAPWRASLHADEVAMPR